MNLDNLENENIREELLNREELLLLDIENLESNDLESTPLISDPLEESSIIQCFQVIWRKKKGIMRGLWNKLIWSWIYWGIHYSIVIICNLIQAIISWSKLGDYIGEGKVILLIFILIFYFLVYLLSIRLCMDHLSNRDRMPKYPIYLRVISYIGFTVFWSYLIYYLSIHILSGGNSELYIWAILGVSIPVFFFDIPALLIEYFLLEFLFELIFLLFFIFPSIYLMCTTRLGFILIYSYAKRVEFSINREGIIISGKYKKIYDKNKFPGREKCSICLENYVKGQEVVNLPCKRNHIFHNKCISIWLNSNVHCPICRRRVRSDIS